MAGPETDYTFQFVRSALPAGAKRLLEIGCGDGALAAMLAGEGYEVVALDSDAKAVAAARALGVDARRVEWPTFEPTGFDAILFTRSLHHVDDLERGLEAAFAALAPGGRLIVEDFAHEEADEGSLAWFRDRALERRGGSALLDGLIAAEPPLTAWWRADHDHDLHSAAMMERALFERAARVEAKGAAYYFRYMAGAVAPDVLAAILDEELTAVEAGAIRPLGRRWVASG